MEKLELGVCPECGSRDCDCAHQTVEGDELFVWSECADCGCQFIEVLGLKRVERWEDWR